MNVRKLLAAAMVMALALVLSPTGAHADDGPIVVGEDPIGDWGDDPEAAPLADALGQDLVSASVGNPQPGLVHFIIKVTSLPPVGGVPEFTRYVWDLHANGKYVDMDGKFTNYSRGVCDATSGQCPPPRDPGQQPFFIRGDCEDVGGITVCKEKGVVQAIFDPAAATITIPVPFALLGIPENTCGTIEPGANIFGGSISASPSAYFTNTAMPMDTMDLDPDIVVEVC